MARGSITVQHPGIPGVWDGSAPVLNSINPTGASIAAGNFTLTATGSKFTAQSVIMLAGVNQPTTFVSPTQLTASVNVSGATTGSKNVQVKTGSQLSTIKVFTFSA